MITLEEKIRSIVADLKRAIDSHREYMKRGTDTGTMHRCGIYEDMLKLLEDALDETKV